MTSTLRLVSDSAREVPAFHGMIGAHPTMLELFDKITRAAPLEAPVLIQGPTGSGKELVAQALHALSKREGPLVAVNVGAIPEQLAESELFGSGRGAYTGAVADRKGLVAAAAGGTLYLDEASELTPAVQLRLLRVLETGKVRALGTTRDHSVNFRLVLSTQRPAASQVASRQWRPDFYYRVAGLTLLVPPLAERLADISRLIDHFLTLLGRPPIRLPDTDQLRHHWPGNVRELRRVVERAAFAAGEAPVTVRHLWEAIDELPTSSCDLKESVGVHRSLREIERAHIVDTLRQCSGDARMAASVLGVSRSQLYRRLQTLNIDPPRRR